jgi:hypothetical protein
MSKPANFKFDVGDQVKDRITGFRGTITGRCEYLTGCRQYSIMPKAEKPNKAPEGVWCDEDRLELIKAVNPAPAPVVNRGGPSFNAPPVR